MSFSHNATQADNAGKPILSRLETQEAARTYGWKMDPDIRKIVEQSDDPVKAFHHLKSAKVTLALNSFDLHFKSFEEAREASQRYDQAITDYAGSRQVTYRWNEWKNKPACLIDQGQYKRAMNPHWPAEDKPCHCYRCDPNAKRRTRPKGAEYIRKPKQSFKQIEAPEVIL